MTSWGQHRHRHGGFVLAVMLMCGACAVSAASLSQGPDAVPDRSYVVRRRAQAVTYVDFEDSDIGTSVPGDSFAGGYGYYGSPDIPTDEPTLEPTSEPTSEPSATPTPTPSPGSSPRPTLPPISDNEVFMRFLATFGLTGNTTPAALLNNSTRLNTFTRDFRQAVGTRFGLNSTSQVVVVDVFAAGSRRAARRLAQTNTTGQGIAVDFLIVLPNNTAPATLATIRDGLASDSSAIFGSMASSYSLSAPTVVLTSNVPSPPPGSGAGQSNTPPPLPSPTPSPGSAGRTAASIAISLLAACGSTLLLGLLL